MEQVGYKQVLGFLIIFVMVVFNEINCGPVGKVNSEENAVRKTRELTIPWFNFDNREYVEGTNDNKNFEEDRHGQQGTFNDFGSQENSDSRDEDSDENYQHDYSNHVHGGYHNFPPRNHGFNYDGYRRNHGHHHGHHHHNFDFDHDFHHDHHPGCDRRRGGPRRRPHPRPPPTGLPPTAPPTVFPTATNPPTFVPTIDPRQSTMAPILSTEIPNIDIRFGRAAPGIIRDKDAIVFPE